MVATCTAENWSSDSQLREGKTANPGECAKDCHSGRNRSGFFKSFNDYSEL